MYRWKLKGVLSLQQDWTQLKGSLLSVSALFLSQRVLRWQLVATLRFVLAMDTYSKYTDTCLSVTQLFNSAEPKSNKPNPLTRQDFFKWVDWGCLTFIIWCPVCKSWTCWLTALIENKRDITVLNIQTKKAIKLSEQNKERNVRARDTKSIFSQQSVTLPWLHTYSSYLWK